MLPVPDPMRPDIDEMEPDRLGRLCMPPSPPVFDRPDDDESDDRKPSREGEGEMPPLASEACWPRPLCA